MTNVKDNKTRLTLRRSRALLFAEREARETQAALEVIIDQEYVKPSRLISLYQESCEIVAILTTIAKRAKENIGKRQKT